MDADAAPCRSNNLRRSFGLFHGFSDAGCGLVYFARPGTILFLNIARGFVWCDIASEASCDKTGRRITNRWMAHAIMKGSVCEKNIVTSHFCSHCGFDSNECQSSLFAHETIHS